MDRDPYNAVITWVDPPSRPATGPLAGRTLLVKDLIDTAGVRTTYGSRIHAGNVPIRTATAAGRLLDAGAVLVGKANLTEYAWGVLGSNPWYGTVHNPVHPGRTTGGSSSGNAAALAAGMCDLGLGSDTGCSIRLPSACCGTVGLKTRWGTLPMDGIFPLCPTLDTVGPMASSVEGCERLMRILAPGFEPAELESLEELEVGVAWLGEAEPLVRERVAEAATLFSRRREIELPLAPDNRADFMREVADVHQSLFLGNEELYGDNVRGKIERAMRVSDADAVAAERERAEYSERMAEAVGELDLVVTPTLAFVAPPADIDELELRGRGTALTFPFSSLGWPALALPCGVAEDGLPASLQLAAPRGADARVLAAGRLLATRLGGRDRPELSL